MGDWEIDHLKAICYEGWKGGCVVGLDVFNHCNGQMGTDANILVVA